MLLRLQDKCAQELAGRSEAQKYHRSLGSASTQAHCQSQLGHSVGDWWFQGPQLLRSFHRFSAAAGL